MNQEDAEALEEASSEYGGERSSHESKARKRQQGIAQAMDQQGKQSFDKDFAQMVAESGLPFSFGRKESVKSFFNKQLDGRTPPSDKVVVKELQGEQQRLEKWLASMVRYGNKEGTLCTLMSDSWTSPRSRRPFVNFLLFVPNHGLAYLGSTDAHGYSQTAKNLAAWGVEWLEHYDLSLNDVGCIIADCAAKCARASKDLKEEARHIQTVTCVAHTLDNCIKEMVMEADLTKAWRKLDAVVELLLSVTGNQRVLAALRTTAREEGRTGELRRAGVTRFASHVIEVQRCLEVVELLKSALESSDVKVWTSEAVSGSKRRRDNEGSARESATRGRRVGVEYHRYNDERINNEEEDCEEVEREEEDEIDLDGLSDNDVAAVKKRLQTNAEKRRWCVKVLNDEQVLRHAKHLVAVATPAIEILREVDSGVAFMGKIYDRMSQAQQKIKGKKRSGEVNDSSLVKQCLRIFTDYWNKLHVPAMTVGYALDPEFIDVEQQDMAGFEDDFNAVAVDILGFQEQADKALQEFGQVYKVLRSSWLAEGTMGEEKSKRFSGHQFWMLCMKSKGCDTLRQLAIKVLAMPVAASPCEGLWSVFAYMEKDKRRAWLSSENLRMQVFVSTNTKLERKKEQGLWLPHAAQWRTEEAMEGNESDEDE